MGRKILFVCTDQQRFDALGCNGGKIARTPEIDSWAARGINYSRAHNQNVVCTPARSTMLTGQYVRSHGVYANGVPLPENAPSIAATLNAAGYATALLGKAHWQPAFDPGGRWAENTMARHGNTGPYRGFDHVELAMHGAFRTANNWHYDRWLMREYPQGVDQFYQLFARDQNGLRLNDKGGGDTGAPQTAANPMPRHFYHTDWVADRAIAWLKTLDDARDWFCMVSFPDPHHPWDPPAAETKRVNWRELDLPQGHPGSHDKIVEILSRKPRHWLDYYLGRFSNREGGPMNFRPCDMSHDQVREINALIHVENELIDEACAKLMRYIEQRGWGDDTDIVFTTDHGELQGDFGLMFKGPYHVDALMRVPLIWRPAPSSGIAPATLDQPVGHVDLAPTFCAIAGLAPPAKLQGKKLPVTAAGGHQRMITEWDSQFDDIDMHLRSLYRDGLVCTVYEKGGIYGGSEGELYDLASDPLQWRNLWDDPAWAQRKSDLIADLYDSLPAAHEPRLTVEAPV